MLPDLDTLFFPNTFLRLFFDLFFCVFGPGRRLAAASFSRFLSHRPTAYLGLWCRAALVCPISGQQEGFVCFQSCCFFLNYFDAQVHLHLTYMCSGMGKKHVPIYLPIIQTRHAYGLWHRPASAAGQTSFLL
jgi:hypothetical protein